jgi:hypothetical protein
MVLGLIVGGAMAAPLAGYLSKMLAPRTLMIMVACVVGVLSAYTLARLAMSAAKGLELGGG